MHHCNTDGDLKTAMYRFNQAYLLDTANTDIFWGYGSIYMAFEQYELAKEQYEMALGGGPVTKEYTSDLKSRCKK